MRNSLKIKLTFLHLCLLLGACHPFDDSIHLINKSNIKITEYHTINSVANNLSELNKKLIPDSIPSYPIEPGDTSSIFVDRHPSVKDYLKKNPDERLTIYIMDFDTCAKYSKMPAILFKKALKKIELSEIDMSDNGTNITFKE